MKLLNQRQIKNILGLVLLATPLTLSATAMSAEAASSSSLRDRAVETNTHTKAEEGSDKYAYHRRGCGHRSRRRPPKKWW